MICWKTPAATLLVLVMAGSLAADSGISTNLASVFSTAQQDFAAGDTNLAMRRLAELDRIIVGGPGLAEAGRMAGNVARVEPGERFYVGPGGSDSNSGTRSQPFASLERAREEVRKINRSGQRPKGGVEIVIGGGVYKRWQTFALEAQDSGTPESPVCYRAAEGETPVFTGAVALRSFEAVRDPEVLARIPAAARAGVVRVDLKAAGVTNIWPLVMGGFASGRGFKSHPIMELYFNGRPMSLARGPNTGWYKVAEVLEPEKEKAFGHVMSKVGHFRYAGDGPSRWAGESEMLLYGYWFFDWADSYEKVEAVDPEKREIRLAPPYHGYGYRAGQGFYGLNALCDLDAPGEWCLDRARGQIYFIPPGEVRGATVELSAAPFAMVQFSNVAHVRMEGLTFEMGCTDAINVSGGERCAFDGCTVRRFAGDGITISGGREHVIRSCDIHTLGRGGVVLSGGDRRTLAPARHLVENCHIYDLSRIDHTYTPAVLCSGVGQRIRHNWLHDIPSSALRVGGNDHVIEFNEINRVVLESDDQGGVDMWGDPMALGNVYRWNFFHHIGNWRDPEKAPDCGQAGIRLDDAICGVQIRSNVFYRCGAGKLGFGAIQIHGGKDNVVDANLFADCRWAISFSVWNETHWREFTAKPRVAPEIDAGLYAARYGVPGRLDRDLNANWIWRNEVVHCGQFLHRNGGGARLLANNTNNPAVPKNGVDVLNLAAREGLPVQAIGLRTDPFRKKLPVDEIVRMRNE